MCTSASRANGVKAKEEPKKQEFTGKAEIDGFEFNEWSRGDRIYYGEISKRRRNGLIPSEGYIDMDTGEIVKEGNWAGYEAAQKFLATYDHQTPRYKAEREKAEKQKKISAEVEKKLSTGTTKFSGDEIDSMSVEQARKAFVAMRKAQLVESGYSSDDFSKTRAAYNMERMRGTDSELYKLREWLKAAKNPYKRSE